MKTTALLLFLSLSLPAYADFAKVIDSDGCANIRSQPSPNAKIAGKVPDDAIAALSHDEADDGWRLINYPTPQGRAISGAIHYSRPKPIHTYPEPASASSGNQFCYSAGPYRLTVNTGLSIFPDTGVISPQFTIKNTIPTHSHITKANPPSAPAEDNPTLPTAALC